MELHKAYQLIVDKLTVWLKEFIRLVPNIALAVLILMKRVSAFHFPSAHWILAINADIR